MRRLFFFIGVIAWFVSVSIILPTAGVAGTLEEVKERGVLIVGVRYDMPPHGFVNEDGDVVGVDIDIAKYIAKKLGVGIELQQVTAKTRIPMLVNGNVDMLAAGIAHTWEREEIIDYTSTYMVQGNLMLVRKDSEIKTFRDLKGKTVAMIQGAANRETLERKLTEENISNVSFLMFQEYPQALLAIGQGKAAAIFADDITLTDLLKEAGDTYKLVGDPRHFHRWFVGLAVRENESDWRDFLNLALLDMWEEGELQRLMGERGFNYSSDFEIEPWRR